jgi:hypothetical protein
MTRLLPHAAFLHTTLSIIMLGGVEIFGDHRSDLSAVWFFRKVENALSISLTPFLYPLFVMLVVLLIIIVVVHPTGILRRVIIKCLDLFTCHFFYKEPSKMQIPLSYVDALQSFVFYDIPTYNVLINPKYKYAFAVSDDFALKHRRIASIDKENDTFARVSAAFHQVEELNARRSSVKDPPIETGNPSNILDISRENITKNSNSLELSTLHRRVKSNDDERKSGSSVPSPTYPLHNTELVDKRRLSNGENTNAEYFRHSAKARLSGSGSKSLSPDISPPAGEDGEATNKAASPKSRSSSASPSDTHDDSKAARARSPSRGIVKQGRFLRQAAFEASKESKRV